MRRKPAFVTYLLLLHLALAVLLVKTDAIPRVLAKAGLQAPALAHIELTQRLLQERRDPGVPAGSAIFLGDSITHGLATASVETPSVNYGIGQQTAGQLLASLPGYDSLSRAGRIYLMIGTNDLLLGKGETLPETFRAILERLPADVPLVWSGLMPRTGVPPEQVRAANATIAAQCATRPNCTYVDTYTPLAGPDGRPQPGMTVDGVHPSAHGYAVWARLLRRQKAPSRLD